MQQVSSKYNLEFERSEVYTEVGLKIYVFWDVTERLFLGSKFGADMILRNVGWRTT